MQAKLYLVLKPQQSLSGFTTSHFIIALCNRDTYSWEDEAGLLAKESAV